MTLANLKQSFLQHRSKTLVLGVLLLVLAGTIAQMFLRGKPRQAGAFNAASLATPQPALVDADSATPQQIASRLQQSQQLWTTLQQVDGLPVENAFCFNAQYYSLDPSHMPAASAGKPESSGEAHPAPPAPTAGATVPSAEDLIRTQAMELHLQSTVMGDVPLAVLNGEVYRVGQDVHGFRIVAIGPGLTTVEKRGLTLTLRVSKKS